MREKIAAKPRESEPPYSHLEPLVTALLARGNSFATGGGFYQDRDGWRCDLSNPIDFDFIESHFELPKSLRLSRTHDSILCENTWIEISSGLPGSVTRRGSR